MSQSPKQLKVRCPACAQQYVVSAELAGKTVQCKKCSQAFRLARDPNLEASPPQSPQRPKPGPSNPPPAANTEKSSIPPGTAQQETGHCGICHCAITSGEPRKQCSSCAGVYHQDCWSYNHGCGMYGCSEAPPTEGLNSLEIPPSHWGQDRKRCPQCSQAIHAAAVRCKHCGAIFDSTAPQDQQSFQKQRSLQDNLPFVKSISILLLIFSLIPCTAPITAIAGTIWYIVNRKSIALIPPFHAALCKIAVVLSIVITLLMGVFATLNLLLMK